MRGKPVDRKESKNNVKVKLLVRYYAYTIAYRLCYFYNLLALL